MQRRRHQLGHHSGERINDILHKKKADLTPDDEAHKHRVHSYVSRYSAQGPQHAADVETSRWRCSPLMNWGPRPAESPKEIAE